MKKHSPLSILTCTVVVFTAVRFGLLGFDYLDGYRNQLIVKRTIIPVDKYDFRTPLNFWTTLGLKYEEGRTEK